MTVKWFPALANNSALELFSGHHESIQFDNPYDLDIEIKPILLTFYLLFFRVVTINSNFFTRNAAKVYGFMDVNFLGDKTSHSSTEN